MNVMRWMIVGALALIGLSGTGCQVNEATGERHFLTLTRGDEIQLGEEAAPEFVEQFGGAVQDAELQRYVSSIGARMARKTEGDNPTLPWEFTLLDSAVVNAFALPGGKVFITRGLAERLDDEAQLAGVLGHEIAHVTAQHANRRISSNMLFNIGLAVGATVVDSSGNRDVRDVGQLAIPALAIGGQVVQLKYGRDDELEADRLGIRYMAACGYDPAGQRDVMQVLASLAADSARQPEWLSTHPYPERRVRRINELLETEYAGVEGQRWAVRYRRDFLGRLGEMPPPRHGANDPTVSLASIGAIGCSCCGDAGPDNDPR